MIRGEIRLEGKHVWYFHIHVVCLSVQGLELAEI